MAWLINSTQLDKFRKNQKNVVILDASFHINQRDAKAEFAEKHIVDARFLNLNDFFDPKSDAPHMLLLDEKIISEKLSQLGIRNDYKIILYDNSEIHSSCRALWMFKVFGHNPQLLYILDGGFKAWEREGGKISTGDSTPTAKVYQAQLQTQYLTTLANMKKTVATSIQQIVDVRHPVRFTGGPEPRPGLRRGNIPGSFGFPYFTLFNKDGTFINSEKLRKKCIELGIDIQAPIVTTCGSGMTAPIFNFLLDVAQHEKHSVYDGSWSEWGAEKLFPGEKDLSERPVMCFVDY